MFRFEHNVPEIYVNESRDFQLLCRLADAVYGGVKYEIDSLQHTANTMEINNKLLPLLKSKLGFFSNDILTEEQLRYLLLGFPEIIRNKGSKKTIKEILYMWFRLNKLDAKIVSIDINNDTKEILLDVNMVPKDTALLDELFNYVLPTGYQLIYRFGVSLDSDELFKETTTVYGINVDNKLNSQLRDPEFNEPDLDDEEAYDLYKEVTDSNGNIVQELSLPITLSRLFNMIGTAEIAIDKNGVEQTTANTTSNIHDKDKVHVFISDDADSVSVNNITLPKAALPEAREIEIEKDDL